MTHCGPAVAAALCPQVASILGLTVQHCPAASRDPRDICSLLQVSTACTSALRHAHGSCTVSIKDIDRLLHYAAWQQQHSALVQESHVDVRRRGWHDPIMPAYSGILADQSAIAGALEQLQTLQSFKAGALFLCEDLPVFGPHVLGNLRSFSQLTSVEVCPASLGMLGCLPLSLRKLKLIVRAQGAIKHAMRLGSPYECHTLGYLSMLQTLDLRVIGAPKCVQMGQQVIGLDLALPSSLTRLTLIGLISHVAKPDSWAHLKMFRTAVCGSMPLDAMLSHVSCMPCLPAS